MSTESSHRGIQAWKHGFTLIESLVVIGITKTLSAPIRLGWLEGMRLLANDKSRSVVTYDGAIQTI